MFFSWLKKICPSHFNTTFSLFDTVNLRKDTCKVIKVNNGIILIRICIKWELNWYHYIMGSFFLIEWIIKGSCMLPEMFNQSVVGDWDIWPQLFLSCHSRITCLFLEHEIAPYIMLKGDKKNLEVYLCIIKTLKFEYWNNVVKFILEKF